MKAILEELAEFIVGLSLEDIPTSVKHQANRCLLDLMGCYWGGLSIQRNRMLLDVALETNPKPEATLRGTGHKAGMAEVAFAHGCVAHHLEYDDGISLGAHWGSETIPAIVAMAEVAKRSGADVLAAIVLAYDVGNRVSRAFSAEMLTRGIHFPCAMGVFGATAGVARLAGLSVAEIVNALGNSCLTPIAPYIPALSGDPVKDAYAGWPNFLGITMTRLARAGWGGPRELLEGPSGLGNAFGWTCSNDELRKRVLEGLGSEFEIRKTYFKAYPCCRWLHGPIQAILDLKKEGRWDAKDVVAIRVEGPALLKSYDLKEGFKQEIRSKFSLPYVVAVAASKGVLSLSEFDFPLRMDPALQALIKRVTVAVAPELDRIFPETYRTRATVKLHNGTLLVKESGLPWGPDNPPTDGEVRQKFSRLASRVLVRSSIDSVLSIMAEGIETHENWNHLFNVTMAPHLRIAEGDGSSIQ